MICRGETGAYIYVMPWDPRHLSACPVLVARGFLIRGPSITDKNGVIDLESARWTVMESCKGLIMPMS